MTSAEYRQALDALPYGKRLPGAGCLRLYRIDRARAGNHPEAMPILLRFVLYFALLLPATSAPKELVKFENCTLVDKPAWADGDSFRIKTAAGDEHTLRLYGADCMEWHINDDSDERRLRAQRSYFGITEAALKPEDAIEIAKDFGEAAAKKTATLLKEPFTVHTRFHKALGNGQHQRIYAFVECADGNDLASELVKSGLARGFGVYADGPGERSAEEYEETLDDLELQSAKLGVGIWSKTNWKKLPTERRDQREVEQNANLAIDNGKLKKGETLNPNTAARDDLMKLPEIGEDKANGIIEARNDAPFQKPEDLLRVPGIKQKTLDKFSQHLDFKAP